MNCFSFLSFSPYVYLDDLWWTLKRSWCVIICPFGYLTTLIIINPNKTLTHVILTMTSELSMCCFNRIVSIPTLAILEATHPISETTLVAICQIKGECLAITEIWVGWGIAMIGDAIWEEWAVPETTMEKWRECADFKLWYNQGFSPLKELLSWWLVIWF